MATQQTLNVSAIVPTYHRSVDLSNCLRGLLAQTRVPDEIVVVHRPDDQETLDALKAEEFQNPIIRPVHVTVPGQVAALNKGIESASGDIFAITDDDSIPRPEWIERIEKHFLADPTTAGVGGRDWVHEYGTILDASREKVGKVAWFGRVTGNHHLGVGGPRYVDVLKGVNMSYRKAAIGTTRFNTILRGAGSQICNDMGFSLALRAKGWHLIYDPDVAVDHYPAPRFDIDQRGSFNGQAHENIIHNETFLVLGYLKPLARPVFLAWAVLVGNSLAMGLVQLFRKLPREKALAVKRWRYSLSGRIKGTGTWFKYHGQQ